MTVLSGEEAPMRIALIAADADAASAEEQCGLARALRDAGQQVAEHVMDGVGPSVVPTVAHAFYAAVTTGAQAVLE